ncbi:acetyl/propionyl/methylcrotonyl-CoA carboxylase subunit alpha [Pseudoruegeria sp. SHC-113]|uniref:acetyl-CoA carboxylase biotin carboxylase subunit n=1 Tax=Pseudoruegeria sp. SHC-113 TaxID=2855439 RepID=UPI0021BA6CB2|nr:acetyl/propionyl/methylcrotonyl-CoA carboxylase subunit alpha [Pseudoruegeria sp. SHC-113]MCT8159476.1 acetyl/propionyl/methylcrotonyl-CoA carboxylase subunit alpha [Pseudoruegeria sp. SHC-113]
MFDKILIANRGEIACRVIETARRLGVATVAVYSDADAGAKHVALADEAVHIGPPAAAESYLLGARLIEAAQATGAQAIHPGYGFLSENPGFVEAVEAAGLTFIGPPADAIRAMGLKDAAKALMEEAGVPVVPGYHGAEQGADFLKSRADEIGYPVLIKARAGGGGKGMRLVERPGEFAAALEGAQREGQASFGDPAVLVEKYIQQPRHIEIQVFGDAHGNVIHLFERDCSLQRRHQKVIEEAPAPDMPPEVRAAMGQAAVNAAKAIGYQGAGTVEFIVDGANGLRTDGFWFMEMNTRLQVEHPVSEAITGLDFVELQLRVAAGEPLPVLQEDLAITGWAFEARVYAEDATKGFLPATGTLTYLSFPQGTEFSLGGVRIDSGVRSGDAVSPWYDPMIAKVITHGPTREIALQKLIRALRQTQVAGLTTNIPFLIRLAEHEGFAAGQVDTGLIARDQEALTHVTAPDAAALAVAAAATLPARIKDGWQPLAGFRAWGQGGRTVALQQGETQTEVRLNHAGDQLTAQVGDQTVTLQPLGQGNYSVSSPEGRRSLSASFDGTEVTVFTGAATHRFTRPDPLAAGAGDATGGDTITAPMPGLVKAVLVTAGQAVTKGQPLAILEAMKMEHTLTAARDGTVAELLTSEGAQVQDGALLLALEPEETG